MHTSIIIISNEPALGINEPLKLAQIKDLNERSSKSNAELSLCLFMLFKFTRHTSCPIRSYRSAPQGEGYFVIFSCLTANKTRKCVRDYGPGCNLKALYLCENKRLPAALLPSRPPPPPSPPWPPAPVAAYLRFLIRGCGDHKPGAENIQRLEKESTLLLSCRAVCLRAHRGRRKTASLFREIWLSKLNGEPGTNRLFFSVEHLAAQWRLPNDSQCFQSLLTCP